jgi:hypothetical protein
MISRNTESINEDQGNENRSKSFKTPLAKASNLKSPVVPTKAYKI